MERRIFGLETEYGVTCTYRGQRRLSPDEVARYLFRRVVSWGRSSNVFLRNGARLYLDVGSHPEYATGECDSVTDLIAHDKAGERILEGLLVDAQKRLHDEGIFGDVYLFKNNTDSAGNSYGCHENYLVSRHGEFGRLAAVLIPFLVTRPPICGGGKVLLRAVGRGVVAGGVVMRARPLENPVRAIREVSHDVTGRRKIRLANNKEVSALEIQQEYLAKATEFVERRGGDQTAKRVVELWGRVLTAIENGDLDPVSREMGWGEKVRR